LCVKEGSVNLSKRCRDVKAGHALASLSGKGQAGLEFSTRHRLACPTDNSKAG